MCGSMHNVYTMRCSFFTFYTHTLVLRVCKWVCAWGNKRFMKCIIMINTCRWMNKWAKDKFSWDLSPRENGMQTWGKTLEIFSGKHSERKYLSFPDWEFMNETFANYHCLNEFRIWMEMISRPLNDISLIKHETFCMKSIRSATNWDWMS